MSLNKTRKTIDYEVFVECITVTQQVLKLSTDGGNTFSALGSIVETFIPDASVVKSGNIKASKLQSDEVDFKKL